MHFLASLTTLLAFGAGIATAAPADVSGLAVRDEGAEILAKAKDAGIDVYGPIPDDYLDYDKETGRYHFGPGSNASLWVDAQSFIDHDTALEKRQGWANIGIGMWAQNNCGGEGYYFDNVQYNVHHYATVNLYSYRINYRGIRSNEQLDFSRLNGGDWCGTYSFTAPAVSW